MIIVRVMLPPGEQSRFLMFEADVESIDELMAALDAKGVVIGERLFTDATPEPRVFLIRERRRMALTRASIYRIETPENRYIEYVDDEDAPGDAPL